MNTLNDALLVAEYESLRAESAHARESQQAILRWSMAAIAIVTAGILANRPTGVEAMILYGLVIPGFLAGATLAWFGEVIRMERVGFFLRSRERLTWPALDRNSHEMTESKLLGYPLTWENYIAFRAGTVGERKQLVGYIGTLGLFVGALVASIAMFISHTVQYEFSGDPTPERTLLVVTAIVLGLGLCGVYVSLSLSLQSVGRRRAYVPVPQVELDN